MRKTTREGYLRPLWFKKYKGVSPSRSSLCARLDCFQHSTSTVHSWTLKANINLCFKTEWFSFEWRHACLFFWHSLDCELRIPCIVTSWPSAETGWTPMIVNVLSSWVGGTFGYTHTHDSSLTRYTSMWLTIKFKDDHCDTVEEKPSRGLKSKGHNRTSRK